jgi:hypothetical protein
MNIQEFRLLPQYKDMSRTNGLKVGDKFLTGARVLNQVDSKHVNDMITYYVVIQVQTNGNISYKQEMERLTGQEEE